MRGKSRKLERPGTEAAEPRPAASSDPAASSPAIRRWLTLLTILIIALWVVVCVFLIWQNTTKAARHAAGTGSTTIPHPLSAGPRAAKPGPWGCLEYEPIIVSQPREIAPPLAPLDPETLAWRFPDVDRAKLSILFSEIRLPGPWQESLLHLAEMNSAIHGLTIRPTPEIVMGMSPEVRCALYGLLERLPGNDDQQHAYRFPATSPDQWFENSGVSAKTRQIVDPLIYRRGKLLFFADCRSVEHLLPSDEERWRLLKALSRFRTLLVRLHAPQDANVEALVDYWGKGGRTCDVRPILESLADGQGRESIDVRHLLPPLPQHLLYTYPRFADQKGPLEPNCHWTSLNFFKESPNEWFALTGEISSVLKRDYRRVSGPFQLGDVAALVNAEGRIIHSAAFIADDVFFTKNGRHIAVPWMLSKLDDLREFYPAAEVRYYRRLDL